MKMSMRLGAVVIMLFGIGTANAADYAVKRIDDQQAKKPAQKTMTAESPGKKQRKPATRSTGSATKPMKSSGSAGPVVMR